MVALALASGVEVIINSKSGILTLLSNRPIVIPEFFCLRCQGSLDVNIPDKIFRE